MTAYQYTGNELELFAKAGNWKRYFAGFILPYLKGNVLEAGAGLGSTTQILNNGSASSWTLLEPDGSYCRRLETMIKEQQLPGNCIVKQGDTFSLGKEPLFDTIIYIDVLEHIEADKAEMEQAARLLKTGGHVIVLSPAHQYLFSPFDKAIGHYRRYNKKTLRATANAMLEEERTRYLDSTGLLASLANKWLLRQSYPTAKQIAFWDRYLVTSSTLTDRLCNFQIGKTIVGIWKKKNKYNPSQI
jgi:SAM-dependent methyltransferase